MYAEEGVDERLTDCQSMSLVFLAGVVPFAGVVPARILVQIAVVKIWLGSRKPATTGSPAVTATATAKSKGQILRLGRSSEGYSLDPFG